MYDGGEGQAANNQHRSSMRAMCPKGGGREGGREKEAVKIDGGGRDRGSTIMDVAGG